MENITYSDELQHWGIKNQKWGKRRFQNKDGSLTPAGKERYNKEMAALKAEEKVLKNRQRTAAKLNKLDEKRRELDEMRRSLDGDDGNKSDTKRKLFGKKSEQKTDDVPDSKPTKKAVKDMTDEEINALMERLNLEKRCNEAIRQQNKGKEFVTDVLKKSGSNVATQLATYAMGYAINKAFAKTFGDPAIINPKKGQKDK